MTQFYQVFKNKVKLVLIASDASSKTKDTFSKNVSFIRLKC